MPSARTSSYDASLSDKARNAFAALMRPHFHAACRMDREFYEECRAFYQRSKTWTWSREPLSAVNLYLFPQHT